MRRVSTPRFTKTLDIRESLSKSQAEGELHNARSIRLAGDDSEGGVGRRGRSSVRKRELYAIEEIKKLCTEFRSNALGDTCFLEDREIEVGDSMSADL